MKKLLIKAAGITNPSWRGYNSGVGRSTYLLLDALNKKQLPFTLELYVNGFSSLNFDFYNWKFKHFRFPVPGSLGCKRTKIEPFCRKMFMKNNLLHIPHNLDVVLPTERYVVTLHDVIGYDDAVTTHNVEEMKKWENMAKNAVGIMTCSNCSKNEIVKKLQVSPDKVTVVYWGICRDKFYKENENTTNIKLHNLGIDFPYFVSISCAHPRKNIRTLLKAYREFAKCTSRHRLVLVWSNPPQDILEEYSREISEGQIVFLNYVSDQDLVSLYNGATCTMFPTRSEGFGFPILESFACGTPIMTCRNTCLEEVGQDVALYVGEDNIEEMVSVMNMFETNSYDNALFLQKSEKLLTQFSWDRTADEYIKFYEKYL